MKSAVLALPALLATADAPLPGVESWLRICFWLLGGAGSAVFLYRQVTNKDDNMLGSVTARPTTSLQSGATSHPGKDVS